MQQRKLLILSSKQSTRSDMANDFNFGEFVIPLKYTSADLVTT